MPADLATARKEAVRSLDRWDSLPVTRRYDYEAAEVIRALRSLLAALPEPAPRECGGRCHEALDSRSPCPACAASPEPAPDHDRISELESLLRECNAVCLCGCPDGDHESDECGESCGHDDHECIRVASAVLAHVNKLRSPGSALPEEVCTCADKVDVGHTLQCREPGPPRHRVARGGRS